MGAEAKAPRLLPPWVVPQSPRGPSWHEPSDALRGDLCLEHPGGAPFLSCPYISRPLWVFPAIRKQMNHVALTSLSQGHSLREPSPSQGTSLVSEGAGT